MIFLVCIFVHRKFYAVRRTISVEFDKCVSFIVCLSSSRWIFVDGGLRNSNVFVRSIGIFSIRNCRTSPNVRLVSIRMETGVDISGKRRRIVVDEDDVFNRFAASCSSSEPSDDADAVLLDDAADDVAWLALEGKPIVWPVPPNGLNVGATRLYSSLLWSSRLI